MLPNSTLAQLIATPDPAIYVSSSFLGQGIGKSLLGALVSRCEIGPWRQMIALIGDGNPASIRLHQGQDLIWWALLNRLASSSAVGLMWFSCSEDWEKAQQATTKGSKDRVVGPEA